MVQPCFNKLWEFMQIHRACKQARLAVSQAGSWDELCANSQSGSWACWVWEKLDSQAHQEARRASLRAYEQARQAWQARRAYEQTRDKAYEQAWQASEQAWRAHAQAAIKAVRSHFEEPLSCLQESK